MYMSSLQSFLWNKAASHRVSQFGIEKVVSGDLVLPSESLTQNAASEGNLLTKHTFLYVTGKSKFQVHQRYIDCACASTKLI